MPPRAPVGIPFQAPVTVTLSIPTLAGLRLHTQGLVLLVGAPLTTARLTNVVSDRILR